MACETYCMFVTMPDEPLTVSLMISVPNIAGSFLASRACAYNTEEYSHSMLYVNLTLRQPHCQR